MAKSRNRKLADLIVTAGVDIAGNVTFDGGSTSADLTFADGDKANFGASSDLQIFHDGSNNYIDASTGSLLIRNTNDNYHVIIQSDNGGSGLADYFRAKGDTGEAILYHYGNQKLATTSTGINVTGITTSDTLVLEGTGVNTTYFTGGDASVSGRQLTLSSEAAGGQNNATHRLTVPSGYGSFNVTVNAKERVKINNNGDVSFYNDASSNAVKMFWDASTERLGIGTTSPSSPIHVVGTATADIVSVQSELYLGSSSNGKLTQSGSSWVFNTWASGAFGERFRIKDTGVDVTGTVTTDGLAVNSGGTSSNLSIRNGSNTSFLNLYSDLNGVAILDVDATDVGSAPRFQVDVGNKQALRITEGGDISFYEDTGTAAKLVWDASTERLGIGTTNPSTDLHLKNAASTQLLLESGNTDTGFLLFGDAQDLNVGSVSYSHSENSMRFETSDTERMRIDASGNLRVGAGNTFEPVLQFTGSGRAQANPGFTFNGDLDTGMFNPSTQNTIAFATAGTERMRINSAGLVGIGRTPAFAQLEVEGDKTISNALQLQLNGATDTNKQMIFGFDTNTNKTHIVSQIAGTNVMPLVITAGNVGISNSSSFTPAAKLDIAGGSTYPALKTSRDGGSAGTQGYTSFGHSSVGYSGGTGADSYIVSEHGFGFAVNAGTNALTITDGGKTGINYSNPLVSLQMNPVTGGGYNLFFDRGNSTPGGPNPWLGLFNANTVAASTYGWGIYDSSTDGSFQIWNKDNSTTSYNTFTIKRGGNVGIGTTVPQSKLETNLHPGASSTLMNANTTNDVYLIRAGFGGSPSTTSNAGAKWGLRFVGRNDGTYDTGKSGAIYAVSEDSAAGYNREVGLAFHVSDFDAGNVEAMRIDSNGHVGIRTTPSAWGTAYAVLDLNTAGSIYGTTSGVSTASNLYFTGSAWLAKNTGLGTLYAQHTGKHIWYSSASVSAGSAAGLSQKMELDASGNLSVVGKTTVSATDSQFYNRLFIKNGTHGLYMGQWDTVNHRIEADANRPLTIQSYNSGGITLGISGNSKLVVTNAGVSTPTKLAVMTSSPHGSYDFYNQGTSYFNGSVIVDDHLSITGSSAQLTLSRASTDQTAGFNITNNQNGGYGSGIVWNSKRSDAGVLTAAEITVSGENAWNSDATSSSMMQFATRKDNTLTTHMTIRKSGNVGIGATSPSHKLHVKNDNDYAAKFGGTGGGDYSIEIGQGTTNSSAGFNATGTSGSMLFKISDSEKMRIKYDGNVGIGTTSPYGKLQIEGNTNGWLLAPLLIFSSSSTAHTSIRDWSIGPADTSYGYFHINQGASTGADPRSTSNVRFTISDTGNVGIGNTIPVTLLHVGKSTTAASVVTITHENADGFGSLDIDSYGSATFRMLSNFSGSTMNGMANDTFSLMTPHTYPILFGTAGVERMRIEAAGDVLIGTGTNLNVLSGTPKLQIGSGTGHASLQFYSGTTSVNGIYFGDTSSAVNSRYSGYIEYRHNDNTMAFRASDRSVMTLKSNGPLLPAGDFGYHTTQEHYTASSNPSSYSTSTNITYNSSTQYWPDQGEKMICVINARAYTSYIHIKTNLTANNIMFMFRTKGYFYATGCEEQLIGGYTYNNNSILAKSNETVAGNTHSGDTYRASDGSLVLKMHVNQTGYTEGKMLVFFHAHSPSTTSGMLVTAVTQKDDGTNAF